MLRTVLICWVFISFAFSGEKFAHAQSEVTGQVSAQIISPLIMDIEDAKRLCAEEEHLVQCEIIRDEQAEDEREEINIAFSLGPYNVYTANFE